jgi:hypothetical protein
LHFLFSTAIEDAQKEEALRQRQKASFIRESERSALGRFGCRLRCGRLRLWFAAIEPAHDIGADGPDVIFAVFAFLPLPLGCS